MGRSKSIDLLRALAVFLVCFGRHLTPSPEGAGSLPQRALHGITAGLERGGWVGVDLFFVLSGFLVSGLLFREHEKFGAISGGQFLIRRGLKIYPSFWLLMVLTVAGSVMKNHRFPWEQTLTELAFLQNYLPTVFWTHTWSLAVEEHFYLLLLVYLLVLTRRTGRKDPFRVIPTSFVMLAVLCVALRVLAAQGVTFELRTNLFPSHLRMDSLFFGVLISYFYHRDAERFLRVAKRFRWVLGVGGVLALVPAFVFTLETTPFIYTYGLTLFYLGSGALLMAGLAIPLPENGWVRGLAYVGSHSYSIYLWHAVVGVRLMPVVERVAGQHWNWATYAVTYVIFTLVVGIGMALVVEFPMLRIRDRWFPPRARPMSVRGSAAAAD